MISTHNGSRHLEDLLISVENQQEVDISLLIRDDGSIDSTLQLLNSHNFACNVKIIVGENLGFSKSYFKLMRIAKNLKFDYLSFCDQDDIWMPDKMIRAVRLLEATGKSHYSSKRLPFSEKLNRSREYPKNEVISNFERAIFENVSAGCTTVITHRHFLELLRLDCCELDGDYDHIINIISNAMNKSYFDQESRIYYRLHNDSSVGIVKKSHHTFRSIEIQITKRLVLLRLLLPKLGAEMSSTDYQFASSLLVSRNVINRLIWVYKLPKMRQKSLDDFALKAFFILKGIEIDNA